jgi:hypothetical protein
LNNTCSITNKPSQIYGKTCVQCNWCFNLEMLKGKPTKSIWIMTHVKLSNTWVNIHMDFMKISSNFNHSKVLNYKIVKVFFKKLQLCIVQLMASASFSCLSLSFNYGLIIHFLFLFPFLSINRPKFFNIIQNLCEGNWFQRIHGFYFSFKNKSSIFGGLSPFWFVEHLFLGNILKIKGV